MNERRDFIMKNWGEDVLEAIDSCEPLNITFGQFLDKCVACGGDWSGMLLSGYKVKVSHYTAEYGDEDVMEISW